MENFAYEGIKERSLNNLHPFTRTLWTHRHYLVSK